MNYVYLDNKYNEYLVDDEAYQQIEAIVQASKYCMYDYQNRHTDLPKIMETLKGVGPILSQASSDYGSPSQLQ